MLTQGELYHQFCNDMRPKFNDVLFERSEHDIVQALKNVITSCRRKGSFVIDPISFEVIEDYETILNILRDIESNTKSRNGKKDNPYDYIDIKDTDMILLKVNYFISIKESSEYMTVYIAIPKIVHKYYMKIDGNIYSAMFQIVDGSTYNNSTSSSKKQTVTMKTMLQPIRIYRTTYVLKTHDKESVKCIGYGARIFNRTIPALKYIFGKFGLYKGMAFMGVDHVYITKQPLALEDDTMYSFPKYDKYYINVPKFLFDRDHVTQAVVYAIYQSILRDTPYETIFEDEYWKKVLGGEFSNFLVEKAISILNSLENTYDIDTYNSLRLPEEEKSDIYKVLRWMIREFPFLKQKDNLDISTKKIRLAEYIASLYSTKLSTGIYRVSDMGNRANIDTIKKVINIDPMFLLNAMTKCTLINYRNMSNDMDAIMALKYTYKGIAGLGNNSSNSVPDIYRSVHPSHLGRVDLDSSSPSDPGINGIICPFVKLDDMSFSDYKEPNFWDQQYKQLNDEFKSMIGMKEVVEFRKSIGIATKEDHEKDEIITQCINMVSDITLPVRQVAAYNVEQDLEDDTVINELE